MGERTNDAAALRVELEALAEKWLRPYLNRLRSGELQPRAKVINDALWGSIRLDSWEVAILDTPLMQRLRFLRQLGVVHWVYPSAGHTRLEHSLGVLHQMEALVAAIERTGRAGVPVINDASRKLLRIAALVHDCGHAVMSHVSERFINNLPGVADLRRELHVEFKPRKKPSASEAFAAVFLQAPAFRELLSLPVVGASFVRDVAEATTRIAGMILGGPVMPQAAFLTLLVNGAYDADKLDYMPRDSMMAGVPCPVDVRRVVETVRVVEVPVGKLPPSYPVWAGLPEARALNVLTLTGSGARVLDELAKARSLLYEKIYFHQKVRALEVMVQRGLGDLDRRSVSSWLDLVDDELLVGTGRSVFAPIRDRDLLKRAIVLTSPPASAETEQATEAELNWARLMGPGEHESLCEAVRLEATKIAEILGVGGEALSRQPPEVDAPPVGKVGLDQQAFVGDNVEEFSRASVARSGQRPEGGKHAAQQSVYIFAPESGVLPVFVAARILLHERYGIDVGPSEYRATRLDPDAIAAAEAKLTAQGYFKDTSPSHIDAARIVSHRQQALETFLHTAWSRLEDLATTFGQYQPHDDRPVSPARIAEYLRQFETEQRARTALLMLEAIEFKNRHFFAQALRDRLAATSGVGVVCPLGATGDSSAFLAYLMNDLPVELQRPVSSLELALDADAEWGSECGLLLWDDFCGQAGHAATALTQWLELPVHAEDKGLLLDEYLVRHLTSARKTAFGQRDVTIAFALARPSGLAQLRKFASRHQLERVRVLDPVRALSERDALFDTAEIIVSEADRTALRAFLEAKMATVLQPNCERADRPWSAKKLRERLLGYGGESHLIVFAYNVPTVTLTALWARGPGWEPLFPRREKPAVVSVERAAITVLAPPVSPESGEA